MPEVADRIPTDFDHHINGTAALAADKASYYASESISLYYREIEKHLKSQKPHENTQYIPDLYKIASDFRHFRRDYLTLVRQVASWMSLVHMLAVPPYRKLIGTEIKRKIIIEILQPYKEQPDLKELDKILKQIKTILYNLRDTINLPYKTYKILLNKKQENPNLPVTLALPGNIQPDDQITKTIIEILDVHTQNILEIPLFDNMLTLIESLQNESNETPDEFRVRLETILIYLLKYKFIGSILGLAITTNEILKNILNILERIDLYPEEDKPKNDENNEIISPSEALDNIVKYMNELSIAQQAYTAAIIYNLTTHTYFTIKDKEIIILRTMKDWVLPMSIPCCIFKYTREDKTLRYSKIIEELILRDLLTLLPESEKIIKEYNKLIEKCLKYNIIQKGKLNTPIPFLLTLEKFGYFESEAIKSSYIQDILSKLYEDMWQGLQPVMVDVQEHGLLIDPRFTDKLLRTKDSLITILDNVMVLLDSIIDQSHYYFKTKKILNKINILILSYLYYKWIHNTLSILIKIIQNNLNKIKTLNETFEKMQEGGKELSPPIRNIKDLLSLIEYNIKTILQLIESYNNLINSILNKINIKYSKIFTNITPILRRIADLPLEQVDNHILGRLLLKHYYTKEEQYYTYKIIIRSDELLQHLIKNKSNNKKTLTSFHHRLLKILSFMIYIDTTRQGAPDDGKGVLETYISKKLKEINNDIEEVNIYIPIKGILKLTYHYAGRTLQPELTSVHVEELTKINVPFHMIILVKSRQPLDTLNLKELVESKLAEETTRILKLHSIGRAQ